jgi:hypothetical protein
MALVALGSRSQSGMTRKHVDMSHASQVPKVPALLSSPSLGHEREQRVVVVVVICKESIRSPSHSPFPPAQLLRQGLELQRLLAGRATSQGPMTPNDAGTP